MKKTAALADSYVRVADFDTRLSGVHLPSEAWAVFAQCDSPRAPGEIARRAGLPEDVVAAALRRLARRKLIQKHLPDWKAYLAASGVAPSPLPAPISPAEVPTEPAPVYSSPPPPPPALIAAPAPPAAFRVETPPVLAIQPSPASTQSPLLLVLANDVAALGRIAESRRELSFHVGKTAARPLAV